MHVGGCLELYYCNMVEWSWWDPGLIWTRNSSGDEIANVNILYDDIVHVYYKIQSTRA